MATPCVYYLCPDSDKPIGGIRKIYRHVDILNNAGIKAYVLHHQDGFSCAWFSHGTSIMTTNRADINEYDYLVIPEVYVHLMLPVLTTERSSYQQRIKNSIKSLGKSFRKARQNHAFRKLLELPCNKVIFNQNCYYTFSGYPDPLSTYKNPYKEQTIRALITVSEDSENYLRYALPRLPIYRIHNAIDPAHFYFESNKSKQACYMPRKNLGDSQQVISLLQLNAALKDFSVVAIDNMSEADVAKTMRESLIFLSFGYPEGFSLPPAEAMACGCIVIGYHGGGGKEFFHKDFSYPIEVGDIVGFSKTVQDVIQALEYDQEQYKSMGFSASEYIHKHYSQDIERSEVVSSWEEILKD